MTPNNILVTIARMYYEQGMTQQEIADQLGLSRYKVLSMLRETREKGIVSIIVHDPDERCEELESELMKQFDLRAVRVVRSSKDNLDIVRADLARATLPVLSEYVKDGFRIGVGSGTTIAAVVKQIESEGIPFKKLSYYPLMGGLNHSQPVFQINDLCRRLAQATSGSAFALYAPGIVKDSLTCRTLLAEPSISQITDCWNDLDVTMIGIGTLVESLSEALRALFSDSDFRELDHHGAVGNICTRFYDTGGNACPMEIHQRMLNISFEQLRRVPVNIAVAGGIHKWRAIRSAMIGKIIDVLVTDEHTARAIVEAGTANV